MRITVDIKGFYDWVPVPPNTEISEADLASGLVKKMADDQWSMRVTVKSPDPKQEHTVGIPETAIAQMFAARAKIGRDVSREEAVAELLRKSFEQHLHPSHLIKIHVDDGEIDKAIITDALKAVGVESIDDNVERYLEEVDLEDFLNRIFKTESTKKKKGA
jgi:hypothetical protein